jgi:hypothetical protein
MRGCLKLLDQVFDLFKDKNQFVDEEEGIEVSLQELLKAETNLENAEKGRLTAFELAWWSMGDYRCRHYLVKGERQLGTFLSYQSEIFGSSTYSEVYDETEVDDEKTEVDDEETEVDDEETKVDGEESSSPRALLLGVLADHRSLLSDTEEYLDSKFEEDVNYNFVVDCEELRFHHACQYTEDYLEYVKAVIGGCVEKGPHVLKYLFQLRNAQGQTPLHAAMDHGSLARLIPGGESGENAECLNMRDSRGWTALHFASAQDYRKDLRELLEDGRADVNATVQSGSSSFGDWSQATPLHLAVINNSSKAVERLLQDPRTDVNALFHRGIRFDDSLCVSGFRDLNRWTALQLAAVAGLPEVVKVLMTCSKVCICLHINPSMTKGTFN